MYTWKHSLPVRPSEHIAANWGGMSLDRSLLPAPPVAYSIPRGIAVNSRGMNSTVESTRRFLNTWAHSLRMMVLILFMSFLSIEIFLLIVSIHLQASGVARRRNGSLRRLP